MQWSSDDEGAKTNKQDQDFIPSNSLVKRRPLGTARPFAKKRGPFGPKKFKRLKPATAPQLAVPVPGVVEVPVWDPTTPLLPFGKQRGRGRRCGACPGCEEEENCKKCENCR